MDNRKINIPSQAGKLLGFLSAYNKEFDALEMIEELYMEKHQSEGRYKAGLWLWKQVLLSIPKYISLILSRSLAMFKNYLKIAIRNLKKSTAYSVLNIIGLSVGMACFVLIALYVKFELSFDNYHENGDNIYRVAQHLREGNAQEGNYLLAQTRMPLAPILKERFPEVIQSIRLFDAFYVHLKIGDKDFFEDKLFFADQDVFKVFTYTFIQGDPETALRDPYSIVLTERTAEKYFGSTDVIGRTIIYNDKYNYKVTGIIANVPDNSHFIVDMLLSYRSVEYDQDSGKIDLNGWHGPVGYTYIVLEEQTDIDDFSTKILDLQKEVNPYAVEDGHNRLFVQPLTKIHLYSKLHSEISSNGDIATIVVFSIIAVLILLIACINYMNLSTARSTTRAREVGLRKVFGARRRHLANQFLGESALIILTALVIAVFLVNLTLTSYNNFVGLNLRFDLINDYQIILILLFTAVFVGLTAGSYPALYISSFKPVTVLRNILNKGTKGRDLRDYLVIGQFAISIILIICTIIVREQLSYINNTDLGYDKDNVIVIKILDHSLITAKNKLKLVKNELVKHSEISGVTSSSDLPSRIFSGTSLRLPGGQELSSEADENRVDINFVDLYDIEIIKGRNFSRDFPSDNQGTFIINETLADMLGYDDPINKELIRGRTSPGTIIGVLKNFNAHSLYQDIGPVYFWFQEPLYYQQYISVKTSGINTQETLDFIKTKTDELLPGFKVEYNYYSDIYNNMYSSEHKLKTMLTLFAMLGIFISCLGIFGLISITTINRTKEIGIRKALGSSVRRIIFLITKDFLKLIVISNLFAWPIAWFAMDLWLQDFAFKTQINISVFIIAGFMALVIMLLSTILQTIKAAAASPVDTLRYE